MQQLSVKGHMHWSLLRCSTKLRPEYGFFCNNIVDCSLYTVDDLPDFSFHLIQHGLQAVSVSSEAGVM